MIKGWDDAPLEKVNLGPEPKHVTFIYPYYCNANFLLRQIKWWNGFVPGLRNNLSAIIVDDGSPQLNEAKDIFNGIEFPFSIRLFKIEVDVRFNWLAARNIAMHHAEGWCVATDMDHVISEQVAELLIWGNYNPEHIYRFLRVEHTGEKIRPHPNSWFMTKEMFWKFGGYDEALSGHYGTDGEARRRWVKTAPVRTLPLFLTRFEYVDDSSTIRYKRKQPEDLKAQQLIKARKSDWKPKVLSFPYHEVLFQ